MNSFLWLLAIFGAAWILGHSRPTQVFRERLAAKKPWGAILVDGLECPACLSGWIGLGVAFIRQLHGWDVLGYALAATATSYVLGIFTGLLERENP